MSVVSFSLYKALQLTCCRSFTRILYVMHSFNLLIYLLNFKESINTGL